MLVNPAKSLKVWGLSFLICKWGALPDSAFSATDCPLAQKAGISLPPSRGGSGSGCASAEQRVLGCRGEWEGRHA